MNVSMLPLALVVAVGKNSNSSDDRMGRPIGKGGKIPWHFSEDMRHFKALTTGHAIIMGRKTFDSIGKALPNRRNIVVTRSGLLSSDATKSVAQLARFAIGRPDSLTDPPGGTMEFTSSLGEAIVMAREGLLTRAFGNTFHADPEPIIIGGGQIYTAAMSWVTRIFLTEVDVEVEGADSFFLMDALADFEEFSRRPGEDPKLTFIELRRRS
jgi:dihydrofolate reductase